MYFPDTDAGTKEDICGGRQRHHPWDGRNCIYGRLYLCGDSTAATLHSMYSVCHTGISGGIFPYFLYKKVTARQTEKITPLIEAKYDEIYEICEKGNKLLY